LAAERMQAYHCLVLTAPLVEVRSSEDIKTNFIPLISLTLTPKLPEKLLLRRNADILEWSRKLNPEQLTEQQI
jgi:hypothetical protein